MHPYIPHLLNDIAKAYRIDIPQPGTEPESPLTFEQQMEEMENYIEGNEPDHSFGYYCDLKPENFPPPEQLSTADIKRVNKAFQQMMFSWNMTIDLPKTMPPAVAYTFIVDCLNEKVEIVNSGFIGIDFCTGYAPDCKLREYCPCLEIWNEPDEVMGENKLPPGDLPF